MQSIFKARLIFQRVLGLVARRFGFNDRLSQFCDGCGRTDWMGFWSANDVWIAVAGNVNSHRHGAYCISCFDRMARAKGIVLEWTPTLRQDAANVSHCVQVSAKGSIRVQATAQNLGWIVERELPQAKDSRQSRRLTITPGCIVLGTAGGSKFPGAPRKDEHTDPFLAARPDLSAHRPSAKQSDPDDAHPTYRQVEENYAPENAILGSAVWAFPRVKDES